MSSLQLVSCNLSVQSFPLDWLLSCWPVTCGCQWDCGTWCSLKAAKNFTTIVETCEVNHTKHCWVILDFYSFAFLQMSVWFSHFWDRTQKFWFLLPWNVLLVLMVLRRWILMILFIDKISCMLFFYFQMKLLIFRLLLRFLLSSCSFQWKLVNN